MEREQIIKALECCIKTQCDNCCNLGNWHEQWNCMTDLMKKALALIKELTEEVADWKAIAEQYQKQCEDSYVELEAMRTAANSYKMHNQKLTEENERLQKALNTDISIVRVSRANGKTGYLREVVRIKADAIRADAVRAFVKKLKTYYNELSGKAFPPLVAYHIEQIEKEFLCDSET